MMHKSKYDDDDLISGNIEAPLLVFIGILKNKMTLKEIKTTFKHNIMKAFGSINTKQLWE